VPNSSAQFGDATPTTPDVDAPVSLGSSTRDTYSQQTAWKTRDMGRGRPLPYSKRSAGSVYKFDDDSNPNLPRSDRGVGRND
jgi:hypothetical protein